MVSCENADEIVPFQAGITNTNVTTTDVDDSVPTYFRLNIEGGEYSVGIIDRLVEPERVTIVTQDMCPFIYYYTIPEGVTPEEDDIEVIATNSSMRHIAGFRDDYGSYAHSQTFHYAVFWKGTINITALFEENWRSGSVPLPKGVDDSGNTSSLAKKMVKVDINMNRFGNVFTLMSKYMDHNNNLHTTDISTFTTLSVLAGSTLTIEAWSSSQYGGKLTFNANGREREVNFRAFGYEIVEYPLPSDGGNLNISIY